MQLISVRIDLLIEFRCVGKYVYKLFESTAKISRSYIPGTLDAVYFIILPS